METLVVTHEVDDVQRWLSSSKRDELFGPLGITAKTFHDPDGSNKVALVVETPSMDVWRQALQGDDAAEAMKQDGVRPETILVAVQG